MIVVAAAWAAALALLVARLVPLWPWTLDDAFITLRYARNWVDAGALAYTPGAPPAEGYTSLVWTLLLAAPHALHLDAERFAKVAGVVATLATLGGTARLAGLLRAAGEARASPVALGAAPVLLASVPAVAAHAVSGMETALCAALATWFLAALVASLGDAASRRPWLLLALGTALGLTRPEGFAFAGLGLGVWLALFSPLAVSIPAKSIFRFSSSLKCALGKSSPTMPTRRTSVK